MVSTGTVGNSVVGIITAVTIANKLKKVFLIEKITYIKTAPDTYFWYRYIRFVACPTKEIFYIENNISRRFSSVYTHACLFYICCSSLMPNLLFLLKKLHWRKLLLFPFLYILVMVFFDIFVKKSSDFRWRNNLTQNKIFLRLNLLVTFVLRVIIF